MIFEKDIRCTACDGTGLYVGFAEKDGAAVVCGKCKGTGCYKFRLEYEPFTGRRIRAGVERVYRVNPGIGIGEGPGFGLEEFGGMPADEWAGGKPFPPGSEDRKHVCPAWWYQSADYKKKPGWEKCIRCGSSFPGCRHFSDKARCWAEWDAEFA